MLSMDEASQPNTTYAGSLLSANSSRASTALPPNANVRSTKR